MTQEGPLTNREWEQLVSSIHSRRDYLQHEEYKELRELARQKGTSALTKKQCVQMYLRNVAHSGIIAD